MIKNGNEAIAANNFDEALSELIPLHKLWKGVQVDLDGIERWSQYSDDPETNGVRRQSSLQHLVSMLLLADLIRYTLPPILVDWDFINSAIKVKLEGEAELGVNILLKDQSDKTDRSEYMAFVERYSGLPKPAFKKFQRAYLVQHALKETSLLPEDAQATMKDLRENNSTECHLFIAIEALDSIFYAQEQFWDKDNDKILTQVLINQTEILDRAVRNEGLFIGGLWTPEVREYYANFIRTDNRVERYREPKKSRTVGKIAAPIAFAS